MEMITTGKRQAPSDNKKDIDPRSLAHRFRSKDDLYKYLKLHLQYYLPPPRYMNKDFLKQVLSGEKNLIPMDQLRPIQVPQYDEISAVRLFPEIKKDDEASKFFADSKEGSRLPSREYFFNVLNTIQPDYLKSILSHAQKSRFLADDKEEQKEAIVITEDRLQQLLALPFFSQSPGKTLMLLKKNSNPGRAGFKRATKEVQYTLKKFREATDKGKPVERKDVGISQQHRTGSGQTVGQPGTAVDLQMKVVTKK